ncbi:hypothetical protein D3Z58_05740 [Clostridiaceae bacterium]|nr:hypothetical protein [Clostridiaceae bacterium]
MIYIKKNAEPAKLLQYRHQPNGRFDDMDADVKEQLRESLLKEQGHLCAYCMRRISEQVIQKLNILRQERKQMNCNIIIYLQCVRVVRASL